MTTTVVVAAVSFGFWTQVRDGPTIAALFLGSVMGRAWAKRKWNRRTWLAAVGGGFALATVVEFTRWYIRGGFGAVMNEFFDRLIIPIAPYSLLTGSVIEAVLRLAMKNEPEFPLGPIAKFCSRQIGWPMHLLAVLAAGFVLWVNRSPRVYWANEVVVFLLWLLLLTAWSVRLFVRMIVLRSHGWSWRAASVGWPKWCVLPVLLILCAGITNWRHSRTPLALLHAVRQGELGEAERALRGGVDVETTARWGWYHENAGESALTLAAARGDNEMVVLLLRHGANVNRPDGHRDTAIIAAARAGKLSTVELLLDRGASPLTEGSDGTALHVAARMDHIEVIALLLNAGVPIDIADSFSRTPLHSAASSGNPAAVQYLLEHGADKNRRDKEGRTPLDATQYILGNRLGDYKARLQGEKPDDEVPSHLEPYRQVCRLLMDSSMSQGIQEP